MSATAAGGGVHARAQRGAAILRLDGLVKHFPVRGAAGRRGAAVHAVDGVDLTLSAGETLALVGESGCGKSTLGRLALRLIDCDAGSIHFNGHDVTAWKGAQLRALRRELQIVFQDPLGSLNPRRSVRDIVAEPLRAHDRFGRRGEQRVTEVLEQVGLAASHAERFPHELSGGQQQRVGIARAIVLRPQLLVLDEPVSALDVSIQAQVLNLLRDLQRTLGLSYLFISHDLAVVNHLADHIAVMYLGEIVELGSRADVLERPAHPYTQALLSSVPISDPRLRGESDRRGARGDPPNPADPPAGCRFRTRCFKAQERCATQAPELAVRPGVDHPSACHFAG